MELFTGDENYDHFGRAQKVYELLEDADWDWGVVIPTGRDVVITLNAEDVQGMDRWVERLAAFRHQSSDELSVPYFRVTQALGTLLARGEKDEGEMDVKDYQFLLYELVGVLEEFVPGYDWRNSITDTYQVVG